MLLRVTSADLSLALVDEILRKEFDVALRGQLRNRVAGEAQLCQLLRVEEAKKEGTIKIRRDLKRPPPPVICFFISRRRKRNYLVEGMKIRVSLVDDPCDGGRGTHFDLVNGVRLLVAHCIAVRKLDL
jgi:hypothetical protein